MTPSTTSKELSERLDVSGAKRVDGYPGYWVNNQGQVFSLKYDTVRELKPAESRGYWKITLSRENRRKNFYAHRLVAMAYIPNPESKPGVNHKDGNRKNNCVENLEWCTADENMRHSTDVLGTTGSGKVNGHWGYRYADIYPSGYFTYHLEKMGIPRNRQKISDLLAMMPEQGVEIYRRPYRELAGAIIEEGWYVRNSKTQELFEGVKVADGLAQILLTNGLLQADAMV